MYLQLYQQNIMNHVYYFDIRIQTLPQHVFLVLPNENSSAFVKLNH